jgi:hypothetical protein
MSVLYVSSVDGNNADSGADWANAKESVPGAVSVLSGAGPHIIYVDSAHDFDFSTSPNMSFPVGSSTSIISVNRSSGDYEPGAREWMEGFINWASGAGNNTAVNVYGYHLESTTSFITLSTNVARRFYFQDCEIKFGSIFGRLTISSNVTFKDCDFYLVNSTGNNGLFDISNGGNVTIIGGRILPQTNQPLRALVTNSTAACSLTLYGVDLSAYTRSDATIAIVNNEIVTLLNCKLSGEQTTGDVASNWWGSVLAVNSSDAGEPTIFWCLKTGTLSESINVYLDNGFIFGGVTEMSHQIVTTNRCDNEAQFISVPFSKWLPSGTHSLNVEFVRDSNTNLTDRDIWIEVLAQEDSDSPLATVKWLRNAEPFQGTPVDWSSSSRTWEGTSGFTDENKQRIPVSVNLARASVVKCRVWVAKPNENIWINPQLS